MPIMENTIVDGVTLQLEALRVLFSRNNLYKAGRFQHPDPNYNGKDLALVGYVTG
jgi:hypothetical protein